MSENFIRLYDNVLSPATCKYWISIFNEREKVGLVHNRQDAEGAVSTDKKDDSFEIGTAESVDNFNSYGEKIQKTVKKINEGIERYLNEFDNLSQNYKGRLHNATIKMQKTRPKGGYHVWHSEHSIDIMKHRILTWTLYLNDDFTGGETEFLYQSLRAEPKTGTLCIFPAGFTHLHRGNPPLEGDKYILTGWIEA
jgi:hypothetical protein